MKMKVKEVADLVGISVRTLHHYDEIGLLTPKETTNSGYRLYSDEDLETLQQILFFKELDFPLKKIKEIISSPSFDRQEALQLHRKMLLEKRRRIDKMIATIDKTTQYSKGEIQMSNKEKFTGFHFGPSPYEKEAIERWGEAADKLKAKFNSMSKTDQKAMFEKLSAPYRRLANLKDTLPESDEAQAAIKEWHDFLNRNNSQPYSLNEFKELGQRYVDDERLTNSIKKFGNGLAEFMRDAMAIYADKNTK